MLIVLLAIIGAKIEAGLAYWICYAVYCIVFVIKVFWDVLKEMIE